MSNFKQELFVLHCSKLLHSKHEIEKRFVANSAGSYQLIKNININVESHKRETQQSIPNNVLNLLAKGLSKHDIYRITKLAETLTNNIIPTVIQIKP
ncbi:hypothetical protein HanIR_Chr04g0154511 [Helianthus annuus]|nr:hypothetical protein HanIR_Chr04g0154511 [Helianthus annuus]